MPGGIFFALHRFYHDIAPRHAFLE